MVDSGMGGRKKTPISDRPALLNFPGILSSHSDSGGASTRLAIAESGPGVKCQERLAAPSDREEPRSEALSVANVGDNRMCRWPRHEIRRKS